jgi:hypothetical protein
MHIRYLKIMFATITSLMALIYVTQNMVNADAAHEAIIYVMSGADHTVYANSFGPKFSHLVLGWIVFITIFDLEYATGLLIAKGALDMWHARNADPEVDLGSKSASDLVSVALRGAFSGLPRRLLPLRPLIIVQYYVAAGYSGIVGRERMASVMSEYTQNLSFADPVLQFGVPNLLHSLRALELYAAGSHPVIRYKTAAAFLPSLAPVKFLN